MKKKLRLAALLLCAMMVLACSVTALAAANVKVMKRTLKKTTETYAYQVSYPRTGVKAIDDELYDYAKDEIEEFIDDIENEYGADLSGLPEEARRSTLDISFKLYRRDENPVGFLFEEVTYFGGAAHPTTQYEAMNFDTRTGEEIDMDDIFVRGWEKKLAKLCEKPALKAMGTDGSDEFLVEWMRDAMKDADIFDDAIVLTKSGILVAFDDYAIGPYAAGAPVISLSNKIIRSIVR